MGLAGPRKKAKISHDPNNTHWSRSTTNFGHKVLTAQGWTPGSLLGVQNASYAEHHTAASESHIRVAVKDDNLGLGAKKGSGQMEGQCVGLDAFQGLLGRLNGKTEEELDREQDSLGKLNRVAHVERRFGLITFIKGGLLIGDKIQDLIEGEAKRLAGLKATNASGGSAAKRPGDSATLEAFKKKKRKGSARTGLVSDEEAEDTSIRKERSRSKNDKKRAMEDARSEATPESHSKGMKSKKARRTDFEIQEKEAKKQRKLARRAKKEAKRLRREKGSSAEETIGTTETTKTTGTTSTTATEEDTEVELQSTASRSMSVGRHAVRQRYIQQKRLAVMDSKALNEIFMIKT